MLNSNQVKCKPPQIFDCNNLENKASLADYI